jgi:hypothetical protein
MTDKRGFSMLGTIPWVMNKKEEILGEQHERKILTERNYRRERASL